MPDAFFASQKTRKRKRPAAGPSSGAARSSKSARTVNGKKSQGAPQNKGPSKRKARDEELASDATDDGGDVGIGAIDDMDLRADEADPGASGEEDEAEAPAEKRLRLARLYLDSVKEGLGACAARVNPCAMCVRGPRLTGTCSGWRVRRGGDRQGAYFVAPEAGRSRARGESASSYCRLCTSPSCHPANYIC